MPLEPSISKIKATQAQGRILAGLDNKVTPTNVIVPIPKNKSKKNMPIQDMATFNLSMNHAKPDVRCYIIDEDAGGKSGYRTLSRKLIPDDVMPLRDNGSTELYLLTHTDGSFWQPSFIPTDNKDQSPKDCNLAGCWDALERRLRFGTGFMEKLQIGILVVVTLALLTVLWLIGTTIIGRI